MTNTQHAELMRELRAIRAAVEVKAYASDVTPTNALAVLTADDLHPSAVAEAFEAEARALRSPSPGAAAKRSKRARGGR